MLSILFLQVKSDRVLSMADYWVIGLKYASLCTSTGKLVVNPNCPGLLLVFLCGVIVSKTSNKSLALIRAHL